MIARAACSLALLAALLLVPLASFSLSQDQSSESRPAEKKLTPEQKEALKKQQERAQAMNALITQATDAINAGKWQEAISPLQQLLTYDPNNWQYHSGLGDCQLRTGAYQEAVKSYQAGIDLAQKVLDGAVQPDAAHPWNAPEKAKPALARMLTNQGNAYLKLQKNQLATESYRRAAAVDPNPALAWFNLCATEYNAGNMDAALQDCDKAIAADPTRADAYFIKGSLLMVDSKTDAQGRVTAPPGTVEALNKYLELAPNGAHVDDVKQMLKYVENK